MGNKEATRSGLLMDRRSEMRAALDAEVERWSATSVDDLIEELSNLCNYQFEQNGVVYQFEVEILENKSEYLLVDVRIDDGRLPYSISSLGHSFRKRKQKPES